MSLAMILSVASRAARRLGRPGTDGDNKGEDAAETSTGWELTASSSALELVGIPAVES